MEIRRLTREELNSLLLTAPESETENLFRIMGDLNIEPYEFFDKYALEHFGIVNSRPLYFCCLVQNKSGKKSMWTVVNRDVIQQFSLYKYCKKYLYQWLNKHKEIYATMTKVNPKNINWTKRLGFKEFKDNGNTITLVLKGE